MSKSILKIIFVRFSAVIFRLTNPKMKTNIMKEENRIIDNAYIGKATSADAILPTFVLL